MPWLLTLIMFLPDGTAVATEMGLMNGQALCDLTGAALQAQMRVETPEIRVIWTCAQTGGMS